MDAGNRYPPQDENTPNNADTEFFRPPQPPQQRPFPAGQFQRPFILQQQPPFQQGQYQPPNDQGQQQPPLQQGPFQIQYGYGQQQPLQPGQFQSAYVPLQQPPFQPSPLQKRSIGQWFASKKRSTKIGLGCGVIFLIFMLCTVSLAAYGSTLPKQTARLTPTPATKKTAGGIVHTNPTAAPTMPPTAVPTQQPTVTPTLQPTAISNAPPTATKVPGGAAVTYGTPQIGGPMSDFLGKYGQPNDHSTIYGNYLIRNHWMRSGNSNADGLIVSNYPGAQYIGSVIAQSINGEMWTQRQAQDMCMVYTPTDAHKIGQFTFSSNTGYDVVYTSSWLATRFSADSFTDTKGNTVQVGTFDVQYLFKSDGSIDSCDIELGSQQTQQ